MGRVSTVPSRYDQIPLVANSVYFGQFLIEGSNAKILRQDLFTENTIKLLLLEDHTVQV